MRGTIKHITVLTAAVAMLVLSACEPKPQPIQFGSDQCDYCRMMITEQEFGTQTLNNQGRAFKFDSIECMAAFSGTTDQADNIHSMWVPDFLNREEWLEASSAVYLHSETLRSPMGLYLSAYADQESAEEMRNEYRGEILNFEEVLLLVESEWLANGNSGQHNHQ